MGTSGHAELGPSVPSSPPLGRVDTHGGHVSPAPWTVTPCQSCIHSAVCLSVGSFARIPVCFHTSGSTEQSWSAKDAFVQEQRQLGANSEPLL